MLVNAIIDVILIGAIIAVNCHIQCDSMGSSSCLSRQFVSNDEQVISPSFVVSPLRVTDDDDIKMHNYCFMSRFVKHVCIRLTHIAQEPKNINVCVNGFSDHFEYRSIARVDLSNEIVSDLQGFSDDSLADGFGNVPGEETKKFKDFYEDHRKSGQNVLPLHPNGIAEHKPGRNVMHHKLNKSAIEHLQRDAVANMLYDNTTIAQYEHSIQNSKYARLPADTEEISTGTSDRHSDRKGGEHCEHLGRERSNQEDPRNTEIMGEEGCEVKDEGTSRRQCEEERVGRCIGNNSKIRKTNKCNYNNYGDSDDDDDDDYFCADDKYVYIFTRHLAGCYTCTETHRMTSTPTQITLLVYASIYQGYVDAVIYVYDPKDVHPQYLKVCT